MRATAFKVALRQWYVDAAYYHWLQKGTPLSCLSPVLLGLLFLRTLVLRVMYGLPRVRQLILTILAATPGALGGGGGGGEYARVGSQTAAWAATKALCFACGTA